MHSGLWLVVSIVLFGLLVFNLLQGRSKLAKAENLGHKRAKYLGAVLNGRTDRLN